MLFFVWGLFYQFIQCFSWFYSVIYSRRRGRRRRQTWSVSPSPKTALVASGACWPSRGWLSMPQCAPWRKRTRFRANLKWPTNRLRARYSAMPRLQDRTRLVLRSRGSCSRRTKTTLQCRNFVGWWFRQMHRGARCVIDHLLGHCNASCSRCFSQSPWIFPQFILFKSYPRHPHFYLAQGPKPTDTSSLLLYVLSIYFFLACIYWFSNFCCSLKQVEQAQLEDPFQDWENVPKKIKQRRQQSLIRYPDS